MKEFLMKMVPVAASDHFPFQCRRCSACCRHVRQSVPLETLDAFRLARYLRDRGEPISCIDDVLAKYTEPVLLHESGYTVFMLKVAGPEDACIFLEDNRCTIHEVNPRACRTYPISVGPDGHGGCEQYLSMEQPQHFHGPQMSVKKWVQKRCSSQDREFWEIDVGSARELAQLLGKVPQEQKARAMFLFLLYRYSDFDLEKAFIPQFRNNTEKLLEALRAITEERNQ